MNPNPQEPTRAPDDGFDALLRQELRWEPPPELTLRLLNLVPGAPLLAALPPPRPKPWYSTLVLVLTAIAIGLSLAVAWQVYGLLGAELGLTAVFEQLRHAPLIGLQRLYEALPMSRYVVEILVAVRDQLHWLLLALVLWLAFDGAQPALQRVRG
ncbi:MAG: anti-sigma factor [Candidatus Viridilinea halotolerans]|uniref:Anti-sigma factor n=1 Tax=Candidatus Viridilinea halotolerans TaxID=2491704 RepID=A0A426TWI4_9CHLR|nr:MAG: anti-sigma factor [Candidatus Viridilinea halotolerans]